MILQLLLLDLHVSSVKPKQIDVIEKASAIKAY